MKPDNLDKHVDTVRRLVKLGYPRARAILAVYAAFGLDAKQAVALDKAA